MKKNPLAVEVEGEVEVQCAHHHPFSGTPGNATFWVCLSPPFPEEQIYLHLPPPRGRFRALPFSPILTSASDCSRGTFRAAGDYLRAIGEGVGFDA